MSHPEAIHRPPVKTQLQIFVDKYGLPLKVKDFGYLFEITAANDSHVRMNNKHFSGPEWFTWEANKRGSYQVVLD